MDASNESLKAKDVERKPSEHGDITSWTCPKCGRRNAVVAAEQGKCLCGHTVELR